MSNNILDEDQQDEQVGTATEKIVDIAAEVDEGGMGEPAQIFPVPDDKHVGVSTDVGTDPAVTDQGDEQDKTWGTPDAVSVEEVE